MKTRAVQNIGAGGHRIMARLGKLVQKPPKVKRGKKEGKKNA